MKKFHSLFLALIICIALILRVYQLDKVPSSLFGDEVDVGYQAYSLLKTGQDLYGNNWPVLLHSLSEYRAPLFIYSTVPFVGIFGLNEWGVRLPAVFWGLLGVIGIYLLAKKLFNEKVALFAALFLAISPWHIQYSRASFEVTMLLTFITFAAYFFLISLKDKKALVLSSILFALTPYIYSTAVIFTPLLVCSLLIMYRKQIFVKELKIQLAVLVFTVALILAPYCLQTISGKSGERFSLVSIFTDQVLQDKVTLAQKFGGDTDAGVEKIYHNKPFIWTQVFTLNYLRAFSPEFLFLQGDPNFRHSIHEMGEMYYFELILLLIGLYLLVRSNPVEKWIILGWLLIAPVPASLTVDGGFHATRTFLMLAPLAILAALGAEFLWNNKSNLKIKNVAMVVLLLFGFNVTFYLHRYFIHYPVESWLAWHYGFKQSISYVKNYANEYDKVLINNTYEPSLVRFLFWAEYDPNTFHVNFKTDKPAKGITKGYDGFSLSGKYFFGKVDGPFEQMIDNKTLLVASARDEITNPSTLSDTRVKLLQTIYSPTNEPIFYILTGSKL